MSEHSEVQAHARVGTMLNDKWMLERVLGIGGMAAVYAARHRNGARAAVKVLHADLSRHTEVRERFLREGYAANKVEHPGVVKVLDDDVIAAGPDAGTAYLVMELLEGESLQDRLERGPPMDEREFLLVAESVLDVLVAAHARGVVHRDLKPENLFLVGLRDAGAAPGSPPAQSNAKPSVKVLDFGLARLLQGQTTTTHGLALGTPSFMSPEQAAGRIDEIDGRTDLFALAATGFRLRTGRRIQEGANAVALVTKMATVAAPRIRSVTRSVSEPFARVIDRALEFRREDRYESAAAMRDDVRRALVELEAAPVAGSALPDSLAAEPTLIASESDLLPSGAPLDTTRVFEPAPKSAEAPGGNVAATSTSRRRAIFVWLGLAVLGGIGTKVALDSKKTLATTVAADTSQPNLDAEIPSPEPGLADAIADDGGARGATDASALAPEAVHSARAIVPAPQAVSSGPHRPPPPPAGTAHKPPAPHHAHVAIGKPNH